MKKTLSISIAATVIALGFSACQEEEFGYTAREINYETDFVKNFGQPDPTQNWSTLTRVTLNYTLPEEGNYNVYVTNHSLGYQGENVLLGQASQVSGAGNHTLYFDMPKGYEQAFVYIEKEGEDKLRTETAVICDGEINISYDAMPLTDTNKKPEFKGLTGTSCIIAFEDLGGTCDWDFNDVVIGITQYSAQFAVVSVKAVGGTLPVEILYNGNPVNFSLEESSSETAKTELHEVFGQDTKYRCNVTQSSKEGDDANTYYNPPTWTDAVAQIAWDETLSKTISHLSLKVDGTAQGITIISGDQSSSAVPQALIIADSNWEWPAENQSIDLLYTDFSEWAANSEQKANWYGLAWTPETTDPNSIPEGTGTDPGEAQAPRR